MATLEELRAGDTFDDELFDKLDLTGIDLADKELHRCTFRGCRLMDARWSGSRIEACTFEDSDLTRMSTVDLRAHGIRFVRCKVMGVEWSRASMNPDLDFEECDLRYASFVRIDLRDARFLRCKVIDANFIDADLTSADFSGSDLGGTSFQGCIMKGTDLSTATSAFVDPAGNRVKGAKISIETAVLLAMSLGMEVA